MLLTLLKPKVFSSESEYSGAADADSESDKDSDQGAVLILDDDIDVLAANARFLRVSGYQVIVANNARTALQELQESLILAVVTDLRMPDMDGMEFARAARTCKPLVPIVFFSAYGSVPDVVAAMQLGAVDFLEKPVDPQLLLQRLDDICSVQQGGAIQQRVAFDAVTVDTPFRQRVLAYEKFLIETSLRNHQGKIRAVLKELNINRRTLNEKMTRLGINRDNLS